MADFVINAKVPKFGPSVTGIGDGMFGDPDNWDAALMVNPIGNAERKARFKSLVHEVRADYDLKPG